MSRAPAAMSRQAEVFGFIRAHHLLPPCAGLWVWSLDCDGEGLDAAGWGEVLDRAEQADVARLADPAERRRMAVARAAFRWVLGRHLGVAPEQVPLQRESGRPRLGAGLAGDRLHLSASRSGRYAAFALAEGRQVGIDVELPLARRFPARLAAHVLTAGELDALHAKPATRRTGELARLWTSKEAVAKALGLGLAIEPTAIEVIGASADPGFAPGALWAVAGLPGWQVVTEMRPDRVTAVAFGPSALRDGGFSRRPPAALSSR
jgi:4'-phosphopantetheinyl transferase